MNALVPFLAGCLAGAAAAAWAVARHFRPRLEAALRERDEAAATQTRLTELQAQVSVLRHDLNGILSPAMLTAGRLTSSEDPGIKRAGDVIIRTVERAAARLAATKGVGSEQR